MSATRSSKSQRESHSEIERKRRERMKRDTEFLRKQVHSSQYKDKLSIFQAAAERLIRYNDKLGKREYIINDEEYSHLITDNFDGFDIHVRCSDGKILRIHPNAEKILDFPLDAIVGRSLQDFAEPSASTKQILSDAFYGSELQSDIFKGLIARNFILALRCGSSIPLRHCVSGSDNKVYRFIEFCGDLSQQGDSTNPSHAIIIFRGLCRPIDPACKSVVMFQDSHNNSRDNSGLYFTLRLSPGNYQIVEAVGDFQALLGYTADHFVQKQLKDLTPASFHDVINRAVFEVKTNGSAACSVDLLHMEVDQFFPFEMKLTSIRSGNTLHCIVCRLNPIHPHPSIQSNHLEDVTPLSTFSGSVIEQPSTTCFQSSPSPLVHSVAHQSNCNVVDPEEVFLDRLQGTTNEPNPPITQKDATNGEVTRDSSPQLGFRDEWFRNVDTSGFQCLLDDGRPLVTECLLDMLCDDETNP